MAVGLKKVNPIASYIIIGLLLAGVFVGSVYFLNRRSKQIRKDQEIAKEDKQKEAESNKPITTDSSKEDKKTAATTKNEGTGTGSGQETVAVRDSEAFPTTGPEFNLINALGIYGISSSMVAYIVSRRAVRSSL